MCRLIIKRQLYLAVIVMLTLPSKMYAQQAEQKLQSLGISTPGAIETDGQLCQSCSQW